jgi:sugar lactone lactonase YvrE
MIPMSKHWLILACLVGLWISLRTSWAHAAEGIVVRLQHATQVRAVAFSPDGTVLASGAADEKVCLWDTVTGKKLKEFGGQLGSIRAVAFAPDGKTLTAASSDRVIILWDVATGQERNRWIAHRGWVTAVAFSPDGKSLISRGEDGIVRLWDLTGREIRSFGGLPAGASSVELSPDGRLLASGDKNNTIHIWETATGRELFQLAGHRSPVTQLVFSPDGKSLASAGQENDVRLWEVATGLERCRLHGTEFMIFCLAFSPRGRILLTGGMDKMVHLWDLATCQQLPALPGHASTISAISVTHDGRRLATGSHDGTILIWEFPDRRDDDKIHTAGLSSKELEKRWNDLATDDAGRAYQAIWSLAAVPAQTLLLLKTHLQPAPVPDPSLGKRITRLVAELDSDDFAVREKATHELEKLGGSAVSVLSHALAGKPSVEARHRMETLLGKLAPKKSLLQQQRAVEVLEHIGTREARKVLELMRQGASDAGLAENAKAALERLAKRGVRG